MILSIILLSTTMVTGEAVANLDRPVREDTIYVLKGDPGKLETLATSLEGWAGGELVGRDADGRTLYYWAYSERTALQAQQFLMPAAFSGLEIGVEYYDQELAFPELRRSADDVVRACHTILDPFFVAPTGRIHFRPAIEHSGKEVACLLTKAKASDMIGARLDIIGSENTRDTESQ